MKMKELSNQEKYAEKWFEKNGFTYRYVKQWISKTVYEISKDGLTYKWELPYDVTNINQYMEFACAKNHALRLELEDLKNKVKPS